jgi:hypothetical protein
MAASASGSRADIASPPTPQAETSHSGFALDLSGTTSAATESDSGSGLILSVDEHFLVTAAAEQIIGLGNDVRSISRVEIEFGIQNEENYAGLFLGGGDVEFRSGSFPDRAITDTWMLDIGVGGRHYFTPPKTFLSPYMSGAIFGRITCWDYRTPLNYHGEIIESDDILSGGAFVGLGVTAGRKERLSAFAEARLGFELYDDATMQGFYNDVMGNYVFISLRAGLSIWF